ncbi:MULTISPECIES: hypothetical protein [unclassified Streptomyces]|uniref:hypothetical protein n=1 Tax=unclassified Streptomyces TaxID=2593676 RepID=UPI00225B1A37|nr:MULTISPECIES: hypothetical protein [unclassified Streptomyces]MCX5103602.1 hypothetical protein [Streptomyces sp. NBC_00439]WSC32193.1 hypothetical protein OG902_38985 [Streptomyces sp. NBC_01768]WSX06249.1 hypothetical protein OG355_40700 [Streptomyces sp. NBC_00987]
MGTLAINYLIGQGGGVGPYLGCRLHSLMLIPVTAGTGEKWGAAHSECVPDRTSETVTCEPAYGRRCQSYIWVDPLGLAPDGVLTDRVGLHNALSLRRSHMLRSAGRPTMREVCHV